MSKSQGANERSVSPKTEVPSVRKALSLLAAFSLTRPCDSLSELARKCRTPKSTAHNLMQTLLAFDLVRQDPQTREYRIGPRAMELGLLFARRDELLAQSRRVLRILAEETGETVKLGVLSSGRLWRCVDFRQQPGGLSQSCPIYIRNWRGFARAATRWTSKRMRLACVAPLLQ
jgi:DNA-binding IclR family transcriptional regulator